MSTGSGSLARCASMLTVALAAAGCQERPQSTTPTAALAWSSVLGGSGNARINKVVLDADGDPIVVGTFTDDLLAGEVELMSQGQTDAFLAKLDREGQVVWARSFGSPDYDHGMGVGVHPDGSIWITGDAASGIDFGSGPLSSEATGGIFVARIDADGTPIDGRLFGDTSYSGGNDLAIGADGDVFVTGSFSGNADFGAGQLTASGASDVFLARFDSSGGCVSSRSFGDADVQVGQGVTTTPEGDVVLLGRLGGVVDFGGGALVGPSGGTRALFVAKFDARLNHIWSGTGLSSGTSEQEGDLHTHGAPAVRSHSIAAQASDRTLIVGAGGNDFSFSMQDFEAPVLVAGLLQQFSRYGETLMEGPIASGGSQDEGAVAVSSGGKIFVAGSFLDSLDFGDETALKSKGGRDVFLSEFDADGGYTWSARYGDAEHSEIAWTVAAGEGRVVVGGWSRPNDTFGVDRPLVLSFRR